MPTRILSDWSLPPVEFHALFPSHSGAPTHVFQVAGKDEALTVAIGVAIRPNNGDTLGELLKAANRAEHVAKDDGSNNVKLASV